MPYISKTESDELKSNPTIVTYLAALERYNQRNLLISQISGHLFDVCNILS